MISNSKTYSTISSGSEVLVRVFVLVVMIRGKQSQLEVLRLRLEFDKKETIGLPFLTCEKMNETSSCMVLKLQVYICASIWTLVRLDLRRLYCTRPDRLFMSSRVNKKRITRSLNKRRLRYC